MAAIDIGTNTALLLIADILPSGRLRPVREVERFVRLGEGVDRTRRVGPAALKRLGEALSSYATILEEAGPEYIAVVGTSASRDAANQSEIADVVRDRLGVPFRVLSGIDEARLTFDGAVSTLTGLSGNVAVVDVGGGSTEVVTGRVDQDGARIENRTSVDLGGVRLMERFFRELPPSMNDIRSALDHIQQCLAAELSVAGNARVTAVGTSGTARALAIIARGADVWSRADGQGVSLANSDISQWSERLLAMHPSEILALNPSVLSGRADILPAGVLVLYRVLSHLKADRLLVSRGGLREGVALEAARNNR